jgi:hypothetical protein
VSTTWYKLREPVAYLGHTDEVEVGGDKYGGWMMFDAESTPLGILFGDDLRMVVGREQAAHRSGSAVTVYASGLDSTQVVSEYGDLTTLGELRKLAAGGSK